MYLLNKVIQFRESTHPSNEKPFLEHLEDLRTMIMRIAITLIISMVLCFSFQKTLMDVLRRPVDQVWKNQIAEKLPDDKDAGNHPLGVDLWEKAKQASLTSSSLEPAEREVFFESLGDDELVFQAKSVGLLRAVQMLPEEKQKEFFAKAKVPDEMRRHVQLLLKKSPSPEVDARGNLRLMSALKPTETFMLSMKLSFFAGIVVSFPLLLYYILQFVLPGMHHHEKKILWPALLIAFGLFLSGVLFAYFVVLTRALEFFSSWGGGLGVSNDWRIGEYISFATQFTLLFGVAFELPVVVMVFVKLGLLNYDMMSKTRSYAIVAIFFAAAVLTPTPDALTLTLMALPMVLLYEICIWLAWFDRKKQLKGEEAARIEAEDEAEANPPPADEHGDEGYHDDSDYRHPATEDDPESTNDDPASH